MKRNGWGTIPEAADVLGVSSKTVRRRIADGSINARKFGPRLIRVEMSSLEDFGRPLTYQGAGH